MHLSPLVVQAAVRSKATILLLYIHSLLSLPLRMGFCVRVDLVVRSSLAIIMLSKRERELVALL